jgi:NADH dehydrogenase
MGISPPTAQHAIRQALVAARNVWASLDGGRPAIYDFAGLGKLGALGHRRAVAELPLGIRVSGFPAWLTWRALYWAKLPGADRKLRVGASWLLDLLIPPDLVQLAHDPGRGVAQARFEPGEVVFRQGDRGDRLYMVLSGEAEIIRESDAGERLLAVVGPGDYFGEIALLSNRARNATVRCRSSMSVLLLPAGDFRALAQTLPDLRRSFEEVMRRRMGDASPGAEAGRGEGG